METRPLVSIFVPLYKSRPFLSNIKANLEALSYQPVEVLISDRHLLDDTLEHLQNSFGQQAGYQFFKAQNGLGWVGHYNFLLRQARGRYYRFMPHDDHFVPDTTHLLVQALFQNPKAVLAYGPIWHYFHSDPEQTLHYPEDYTVVPNSLSWTLDLAFKMDRKKLCPGAFKGLIDLQKVKAHQLQMKEAGFLDDRPFLTALALLGRFVFVPEAKSIKRLAPSTASSEWLEKAENSANQKMLKSTRRAYLKQIIKSPLRRWWAKRLLHYYY